VRDTRAQKIRDHSRGSEGGLTKLDFSLILSLARQLPASHDAGLDEREQQVFWLRGRPTSFALPLKKAVAREAFVTRYKRRYRARFTPASYSPQTVV